MALHITIDRSVIIPDTHNYREDVCASFFFLKDACFVGGQETVAKPTHKMMKTECHVYKKIRKAMGDKKTTSHHHKKHFRKATTTNHHRNTTIKPATTRTPSLRQISHARPNNSSKESSPKTPRFTCISRYRASTHHPHFTCISK